MSKDAFVKPLSGCVLEAKQVLHLWSAVRGKVEFHTFRDPDLVQCPFPLLPTTGT